MNVLFTFSGGFKDAQSISGSLDGQGESNAAVRRYWFLTNQGTIGTRFREMSDETRDKVLQLLGFDAKLFRALAKKWGTFPHALETGAPTMKQFNQVWESVLKKWGLKGDETELLQLAKQIEATAVSDIYEVADRTEDEDQVRIRLQYVGSDATSTRVG